MGKCFGENEIDAREPREQAKRSVLSRPDVGPRVTER